MESGQKGPFKAVRGSDGSPLWEIGLWNGAAVPVSSTQQNVMSSVLAVDIDGDGQVDFVVGGADGWLYAVEGAAGSLLWGSISDAPSAIRSRPTSTATAPAKCSFPPPTDIFTRSVRGSDKIHTAASSS